MLGQIINFVDHNDFKSFLLLLIELLTSRNLFDEFLDNDFVMIICLTWSDFDVIIR